MSDRKRTAVIDIGSNSVRLVVYAGANRAPEPVFNEKVMAGLGAGLQRNGDLSGASMESALAELTRFRLLLDQFGIDDVHVVATAAVRDAGNGPDFVKAIRKLGLPCRVLEGEEEARLAGAGVISSTPSADGLVADLGGGSVELVDVANGVTGEAFSLPLGTLRATADDDGENAARKLLKRSIKEHGLRGAARGRTFYLVGGSWRCLAKAHMALVDYPLRVTHEYPLPTNGLGKLRKFVASDDPRMPKDISPMRLAGLPVGAMLVKLLAEELEPDAIMVSAFGIREGLLYSLLPKRVRGTDPLLAALEDSGHRDLDAYADGFVLDEWIGGLFDDEPHMARIRCAASLLAASAGKASGPFRAERAIEAALHGNWPAINAPERVLLAQALRSSFGRTKPIAQPLADLCHEEDLVRAHEWGLALRLALRFSGGASPILETSGLEVEDGSLRLVVQNGKAALVTEVVQRRLLELADALGLGAVITAG
jgi:exopolyphosphatase/guanosine-5'-triphosphate,3'-diphosphate pyrophosphatase